MWWFKRTGEGQMRQRLKRRLGYTQVLGRNLGTPRLLPDNITLVQCALDLTKGDEQVFQHYFGEPMPLHWQHAVHAEGEAWGALAAKLFEMKKDTPSFDMRARQAQSLVQRAQNILLLQQQMITSPLSQHFQRELRRLS